MNAFSLFETFYLFVYNNRICTNVLLDFIFFDLKPECCFSNTLNHLGNIFTLIFQLENSKAMITCFRAAFKK